MHTRSRTLRELHRYADDSPRWDERPEGLERLDRTYAQAVDAQQEAERWAAEDDEWRVYDVITRADLDRERP